MERTRRLTYALLLVLLISVLLGGGFILLRPKPERPPVDSSRFASAPCPFIMSDDEVEGETYECGYLTVPEDRGDPASPTIQLAVAILRSTHAPKADPVLYLAGGPGGSAVAEVWGWMDVPFLDDHDLILLDQRGTGYSQPRLYCPELDDYNLNALEALSQCRERLLREGVNLAAYNSAASAADVNDLRSALGYDEWNLLGISYGARLALTVMRDYPEGIRSVVLDSPYPPQVSMFEEQGENGVRAFQALFQACAEDPACDAAYPDLETVFYDLVDYLNANPVYAEDGSVLNGDYVVDSLYNALYNTDLIPLLPLTISLLDIGQYEAALTLLSGEISGSAMTQDDVLAIIGGTYPEEDADDPYADAYKAMKAVSTTDGAYYAVECYEELPFNDWDVVLEAEQNLPAPLREGLVASSHQTHQACAIWEPGEAPAIESEPVSSAIPALVLVGEFDPITPPAWGQQTAEHLSQGFYFLVPGAGHALIDAGECPRSLITSFLADPSTAPDGQCLSDLATPGFFIWDQ